MQNRTMGKRIGAVVLLLVIPVLLLLVALRFVRYEQTASTKNIAVAVVDHDQAASFQGKRVAVGAAVKAKLKKDDQVSWHFVSAAHAKAGLANGTYLLQVTLPRDFSQNVTTALAKQPQQSTIELALSAHNNFASHVITTTVANQLRSQVVQNIQQAYDSAVLAAIKQLGSGVTQAANGTQQLATGSKKILSGDQQLAAGLTTLQGKTGPLSSGVAQLADGSQQLHSGLGQLSAQNKTLTGGMSSLNAGVTQLTTGSQTLAEQLAAAATTIDTQLSSAQPDLKKLDAGLTQLDSGVKQLVSGVNDPAMAKLNTSIKTNLTGVGSDATKIKAALTSLNSELFDQTDDESAASQLQSAGTSFTNAGAELTQIQKALMSDPQILSLILTKHSELLQVLPALQANMTNGGKSLTAVGTKLQAAGGQATSIKNALVSTQTELLSLQSELTTLNSKMNDLTTGLNTLGSQTPTLVKGTRQAISTLQAGLTQVSTGLSQRGTTTATTGAVQGTQALHDGLTQVLTGLRGTSSSLGLIEGVQAYTNGVSQANTGSAQLVSGLTTLNESVPALTSGVTQLTSGAKQVLTGNQQLNAGIGTLNVKLAAGSKQVAGLKTSAANVDQFVTPVSNKTASDPLALPLLNVLAPLVVLMVSFIAALLTEVAFVRYSKGFAASKRRAKLAAVGVVTVLQAGVLTLATKALGVSLAAPVQTFILLVLSGALFTLIVFVLDRWLGTVGVLLALALLFVQLIVSGGLLPNQMLSGLYQVVAKCLPGTYVLNLLNWTINGLATSRMLDWVVLLVFAAVFSGLLLLRRRSTATQTA